MFDNTYTQTLQDQIGQLSKLLGGQAVTIPDTKPANQYDYVAGLDGARAYQQKMLNGTKHIVWDSERPAFYILQRDSNGSFGRIQIGEFTLTPEPTMEEKYVSRQDFNALAAKIDQLLSQKTEVTDG